ncbi:MAG TPA: hypothetical protein VEA69_22400 [Tepidisphaeraceae bacterium]|nr:hypothetical protein [Tepidisphaeraceae bacterium]
MPRPESPVKSIYRAILADGLAPPLLARGFKSRERGETFVRSAGDVDFHAGASFLSRGGAFGIAQIAVGLSFRSVQSALRRFAGDEPSNLRSGGGIVTNLSTLVAHRTGRSPTWDTLDASSSDPPAVAALLRADVTAHALPFLDDHADPARAIAYWSTPPHRDPHALAVALALRGDRPAARHAADSIIADARATAARVPGPQADRQLATALRFAEFVDTLG